mmetsp:Transcript_31193/g.61508  ORF Transcript_31193/g.61508 Transcript_31193/m.61508 type:complete len:112 (+) Transcript_31193:839-1174(+)
MNVRFDPAEDVLLSHEPPFSSPSSTTPHSFVPSLLRVAPGPTVIPVPPEEKKKQPRGWTRPRTKKRKIGRLPFLEGRTKIATEAGQRMKESGRENAYDERKGTEGGENQRA